MGKFLTYLLLVAGALVVGVWLLKLAFGILGLIFGNFFVFLIGAAAGYYMGAKHKADVT